MQSIPNLYSLLGSTYDDLSVPKNFANSNGDWVFSVYFNPINFACQVKSQSIAAFVLLSLWSLTAGNHSKCYSIGRNCCSIYRKVCHEEAALYGLAIAGVCSKTRPGSCLPIGIYVALVE
jgi:hypothetical protein